ncbi:MAG: hypothetical protein UW02_C0030G0001 [Candidatus Nomurabacteria bacterium GW2011_GWB1_43_7]|uniref:Uncharacterized protein n=1 Tax=Candidatus Nomurabacteria bacterium GW2011_GWB1_43_7 TaxID=1618747 RepID=A0A0G1F869_9BACT|nr:MAG: hypothetical protein UW02_C0030G0001 [Candidatus Nomurabacteria bacterium GW2011_GWB1_43_7]
MFFMWKEEKPMCSHESLLCGVPAVTSLLSIDRTKPFNPAFFIIGTGWSIDEEDQRSLSLTKVDLTKVRLETMLKSNENVITGGEEKLERLKEAGYIRLDAKILWTLWENQSLIPESWKEKINGNIRFIYFDGTVLQDSNGDRYVLYLDWDDGKWSWNVYWLDSRWFVYGPSAVLGK